MNTATKHFTSILFLFFVGVTFSQTQQTINSERPPYSFYSVQNEFEQLWQGKIPSVNEEENAEEGGYQQFKRWEYFMKPRTYPSGKIPNPDILMEEYFRTKSIRSSGSRAANWSFVGTSVVPPSYNKNSGAGRLNCLAIHPTNSNIMYAGAACGGVWKTTNGGVTWTTSTDQLASISISDIAIDPVNPNNIYIATGDGYGAILPPANIFFGGTYSAGVMKSTDGGNTWSQAGLTYNQTQTSIIHRLIIHPSNPNILLAATTVGIYQTTNKTVSWTKVKTGSYYDIEFNSVDPSIVYAVNDNYMLRSIDGGTTFANYSNKFSYNSSGRVSLAVSTDTTEIYAFTGSDSLFISNDGGQFFSFRSKPPVSTYGHYGTVLAVSPVNSQHIIAAGIDIAISINGGNSWTKVSANKVHPDVHYIKFTQGSNTSYFVACDGGLYKTTDDGITWNDLSSNLAIKQYYRISSSPINSSIIYVGAQDNGTEMLVNGTPYYVFGSDGMDCISDYNDLNTAYISYQNGNFFRTKDACKSYTKIYGNGAWVSPIVQNPINPNSIYVADQSIRKSVNQGTNFTNISSGTNPGNNFDHIAIAPSDTNTIYACTYNKIYRTTTGGSPWTDITSGLASNAAITNIAVSSKNPQHIWMTFSGYVNGKKVYKSTNGGTNWTNVSGTLPNIPVNCIVYQQNSNDDVYIGTDFGVYYMNASLTDWQAYQTNLPNVMIDDIEINYTANKLRVATFGRGVWESDPNTSTLKVNDAGINKINEPKKYHCSASFIPVVELKNYGTNTISSVDVKYKFDGGALQTYNWTGTLQPSQTTNVLLPNVNLAIGNHSFLVYTQNPNGLIDTNSFNDSKQIAFLIDTAVIAHPLIEGFETANTIFPPVNWRVEGANTLTIANSGGFANSVRSLKPTRNALTGISYFISEPVNFNTPSSLLKLEFSLCYYQQQPKVNDTLKVSISTNCGLTWMNVYTKTGSVLETAPDNTSVPTSAHWRTESIDLSSLIGSPEAMVRFEIPSTFGHLYIDDINLYGNISTTLATTDFDKNIMVAPVPFTDFLTIRSEKQMMKQIMLRDITGRVIVNQSNLLLNAYLLNTNAVSNGVYLIQVTTENGTYTRKIIKD